MPAQTLPNKIAVDREQSFDRPQSFSQPQAFKRPQSFADLTQISIEQIVARIFLLNRITRMDQDLLMSALFSKQSLTEVDKKLIGRVFDAVQQGKLKVGAR